MVQWTVPGRTIVFFLSATSIWCLLAEFYGLCSMRWFTLVVLIPATLLLLGLGVADRARGDRRLWRAVVVGSIAGFLAAVAYDVFRLPFVYSREWGLSDIIPPLQLFKVFPRFGAMILGEPVDQREYSSAAHTIGWVYHFSNGVTFGVMYMAIVGDAGRRSWLWGVVIAMGLELAMLTTPYPEFFRIPVTAVFVTVTLAAHLVFGASLGLTARQLIQRASRAI